MNDARGTAEQMDRRFQDLAIVDPTEGMTDDQRQEYIAKLLPLLPVLRKEVAFLVSEQVIAIARRAEDERMMLFHRGGISFGDLLLERWEGFLAEHQQRITDAQAAKQDGPDTGFPRV